MRRLVKKLLITLSLILGLAWSGFSAVEYVPTKIDVTEWKITIWAPKTMIFPTISVQAYVQEVQLSTLTWEYFWVEDLKSTSSGYYTQVSISDLTSTWWNNIRSTNIQITTTWGVTTLDWQTNAWVYIPSAIELWFQSLENPLILIRRNTNANWSVWKYWVKPIIKIIIPAMQPAWIYSANLTFTLIEY